MRLWSLHPKYLDRLGLLALWREALLAQKVLRGETRGYRNHPQLIRFKRQADPVSAIAAYLTAVHEEASRRAFRFDRGKIVSAPVAEMMRVSRGQLLYEWDHLKEKLKRRDERSYRNALVVCDPKPHPLFTVVDGPVAEWEIRA